MAARKRRAKSSITRLPEEQRAYVERLLRSGQLTLDEMISDLQARFPGQAASDVSRSALHRYEKGFSELTGRMREIQSMAEVVVGELAEGVGDKAGALLVQAITTLATNAALKAHESDDVAIEDVRKLAMAAKNAIDAQRMDVNVRRSLREEARTELLREQDKAMESIVRSGGLSAEKAEEIRRKLLMGGQ